MKGASKLKWLAKVEVTLKKAVLDPQGVAVEKALAALGYSNVEHVRIGKYMELVIDAPTREEAGEQTVEMSRRLLSNPVIEDFNYSIREAGR